MKLKDIYTQKDKPKISFEVFPPKEVEGNEILYSELEVLRKYNPSFISLTWGAGGKNNNSTDLITRIKKSGFEVMPHFTCVSSSKEFVKNHITTLNKIGIQNILALRGDIPADKSQICGDFQYASELVEFLKSNSDLSIGVAGYPEGHIEAESIEQDIKNLKHKVSCGADVIFTQLFYDNDLFYKYTDKIRAAEITVPVVPGIMPVLSKKQIDRMTTLARITVPNELKSALEKYDNNNDIQKFGVEFACRQCENLIKNEIKGIHFYTLNKSKSICKILDNFI